jgi:hypothetical protein
MFGCVNAAPRTCSSHAVRARCCGRVESACGCGLPSTQALEIALGNQALHVALAHIKLTVLG